MHSEEGLTSTSTGVQSFGAINTRAKPPLRLEDLHRSSSRTPVSAARCPEQRVRDVCALTSNLEKYRACHREPVGLWLASVFRDLWSDLCVREAEPLTFLRAKVKSTAMRVLLNKG